MEKVLYQSENQIGKITLNDPENGNTIDTETLGQIIDAFRLSRQNKDVCVIYAAEGRNFTFGANLKLGYEMMTNPDKSQAAKYLWDFQELTCAMVEHPGIIIAGYQGYVVGGGFEHTLICDLRIAAEDTIILLPELDAGLFFSNASTQLLSRIIGLGRAKQMMLMGEELDARKALDMGLVNYVCKREDLDKTLAGIAQKIVSKDHTSLKFFKEIMNTAHEKPMETILYQEGRAMIASGSSQGAKKRLSAFINKR